MVTVGPTFWGEASSNIRVAVFVHELGHNLALSHGGWDEINYKPNYYSVMNYQYTLTGVPMADGSRYFGYSTAEYRMLNEAKLYERAASAPARLASCTRVSPPTSRLTSTATARLTPSRCPWTSTVTA